MSMCQTRSSAVDNTLKAAWTRLCERRSGTWTKYARPSVTQHLKLPAKKWPNFVASLNVLLQVKSFTWGTIFVLNGISLSVHNMEMQNELKHWETMAKDNKGQIWQEGRKGLKGPKLRGGRESLWRSTSPLKSPFAHSPSRATNAFEWHDIHRELYDLSRLSPSPHPFRHQWQLRYATRLEEILKTIPC